MPQHTPATTRKLWADFEDDEVSLDFVNWPTLPASAPAGPEPNLPTTASSEPVVAGCAANFGSGQASGDGDDNLVMLSGRCCAQDVIIFALQANIHDMISVQN